METIFKVVTVTKVVIKDGETYEDQLAKAKFEADKIATQIPNSYTFGVEFIRYTKL